MSDGKSSSSPHLQLGDIIRLQAPADPDSHEQTYLIKYLDKDRIVLSNVDGVQELSIPIRDGKFPDTVHITQIEILNRAAEKGFARQNNLLPGTWIDLHFGGDIPAIFTGEVSDLDEDMVEIRTIPDDERIYIDFGYKGVPLDLPLEKIVIREKPTSEERKAKEGAPIAEDIPLAGEDDEDVGEMEEVTTTAAEVKTQLREMLLDANQIQLGVELDAVTQVVEVPEERQRFGIEKQTADMLDELLATIPNSERTNKVLNNLHRMIERFKQLRIAYSEFDEQGNAMLPKTLGAGHKPLVDTLANMNRALIWLLPVVQNRKKVYDVETTDSIQDVEPLTLAETRIEEAEINTRYLSNDVPEGENKVSYLMNNLQPYLTPFINDRGNDACISDQTVEANITAVVDTLEDFYSSVAQNELVKRHRFLIQKYNLGLRKLQVTDIKGNKTVTKSVPLTPNDNICVTGFLTLPEPVVRFSHVHLPTSNMLTRSDLALNYVQYWELLRKSTLITPQIVPRETFDVSFNSDTFLTGYQSFSLETDDVNAVEDYAKFLEAIVPRTRILFNAVKRYITGSLSLYSLVQYLEPFMVYQHDLTFKQYEEMMHFIHDKVNTYKRKYIEHIRSLNILVARRQKYAVPTIVSDAQTHTSKGHSGSVRKTISDGYDLPPYLLDERWSSSEVLARMTAFDNARYYSMIIAVINRFNVVPSWAVSRIDEVQQEYLQVKGDETPADKKCTRHVLTKKYRTLEDLEADNGKTVFFDPRYDPTRYEILDEYRGQQDNMSPDDFIGYLEAELIKNVGMTVENAQAEAHAMVTGKREARYGEYAVLRLTEQGDDDVKDLYYKRAGDMWELDETIDADTFTDESKVFCNLQPGCFQVKERCLTGSAAEEGIDQERIKSMVDEFADQMEWDSKITETTMGERLIYLETIMRSLHILKQKQKELANSQQLALAGEVEEHDVVHSPYEKLRDLILGQADFVKRQNDIVRFCQRFTRAPQDNDDPYWLYDEEANVKLLPIFLQRLAVAFVSGTSYFETLSRVCAEQGTISDDGEAWVDKHSGYVIRSIEFDTEEGFTEAGFKQISREIMEADLGNAVLEAGSEGLKKETLSPQAQSIVNVVSTLTGFMGINIESQKEFIIRNVMTSQKRAFPSEEAYAKAVKLAEQKGKKKLPSYEDAYDESLLLLTLSYLVVAIQIAVPSVATRKTHPGCKRSFGGFPLDGESDMSGITYIACISHKIKSSVGLWRTIKKKPEATLVKAIRAIMDRYIVPDSLVQEKLFEKRTYLSLQTDNEIPVEIDVRGWSGFLPPLLPVNLPTPNPVADGFKQSFKDNLKKGDIKAYKQLGVLQGKIIYFSLAIIQLIQEVVSKKTALLTNAASEPFIENACCNEGLVHPARYFAAAEPNIIYFNNLVKSTTNLLLDVGEIGDAPFLFDPRDTKLRYPTISDAFSEETIYKAFIAFCHFNNNIPISEALRKVCISKPETFDVNDAIEEKMRKLRLDGYTYGIESLDQLMQVINTENIIPFSVTDETVDPVGAFKDIVSGLVATETDVVAQPLLIKLEDLASDFSTTLTEDVPSMRAVKNYLAATNTAVTSEIESFMRKYSKLNRRQLTAFAQQLNDLPDGFSGSQPDMVISKADQSVYKAKRFLCQTVDNFLEIFPNMIINQVDYNDAKVPRHWKLSQRHNMDIQEFIKKRYAPLRAYYKDQELQRACTKISRDMKDLILLANNTPFYASTRYVSPDGNVEIRYSTFDSKTISLLYKHFVLTALLSYVHVVDDDSILVKAVPQAAEGEWATGEVTEVEVVRGEKKALGGKIASLLVSFLEMTEKDKTFRSYSYEQVMERVLRSKEKEKDNITDFLKGMTDEEREIENLFKNNRLERWSKGLQKGLTQYVQKTYDEEREDLDRLALMEKQLGKKSMVTDMNRDIYALDQIAEDADAAAIDAEEYDMSGMPEDDDAGEDDAAYGLGEYDD